MKLELVESIASAVLYEGYLLYPYRASALKNRQRFNFGVVYPQSHDRASNEPWNMQTECLVEGDERTSLDVRIRFLHLIECAEPGDQRGWQEAVEREVIVSSIGISSLTSQPQQLKFEYAASQERPASAAMMRRQEAINGMLEISVEEMAEQLFKLTVRVLNLTTFEARRPSQDEVRDETRDETMLRAFVSTHAILNVWDGAFISLLDPPDELRVAAAACHNVGTYPVLVGIEGERDCLLSSPIILYDYPQIAPESAGDLFDGTEIDEILTLRILTLTDAEKQELRTGDPRARRILERSEALPAEHLMKMHGVLRGLQPQERSVYE